MLHVLNVLVDSVLAVVERISPSSAAELRILYSIVCHPVRGSSHKERLESFYANQATGYDGFRRRLLHGREEMVQAATKRASGGIWVDMGGGTAANLEMAGDEAVMTFAKIYVVDLCGPLLEVARQRCLERGWHNVEVVEGDATSWVPDEGLGQADLVTFSYSLTMIPDWFAAMSHAEALLSADGVVGAVDFYVSRKYAAPPLSRHSYVQRSLWPYYFSHDDVRLSSDHVPYLMRAFKQEQLVERSAPLPYIGMVLPQVPYYTFIGSRRSASQEAALE